MITNALIAILYAVIFIFESPLTAFTDVAQNSAITSSLTQAGSYLAAIPFGLFVASVLASLTFLLVFEGAFWLYKGIRWVYRKVPGIS